MSQKHSLLVLDTEVSESWEQLTSYVNFCKKVCHFIRSDRLSSVRVERIRRWQDYALKRKDHALIKQLTKSTNMELSRLTNLYKRSLREHKNPQKIWRLLRGSCVRLIGMQASHCGC